MNIEEIRKGAPEGATHWREWFDKILYYKVDGGEIICRLQIGCGCEHDVDWSLKQAYSYNRNELKPLY